MNTVVRNILALIAGFLVGGDVNMGIVMISGSVIPLPAGADTTTMEGLKEAMHLFEAKLLFTCINPPFMIDFA
ncbi:hypothetical protein [Ancylomarina sp.]|uniref:hypothetical protein n=1 Tax=Ancylomarina sp. TaxID=1970196 RepID=UPI003561EFEF